MHRVYLFFLGIYGVNLACYNIAIPESGGVAIWTNQ